MRLFIPYRVIAVIALAVVFVWVMPRSAQAQCTTSGATYSCDFSTSGQTLFGGQVSSSATVGVDWSASGSAGDIVDAEACVPVVGCVDLGSYGAELSGSTSGNIGLDVSAVASGGTISANIPTSITLQLPTSAAPGSFFNVSASGLSFGSSMFSVQSPSVGLGVGLNFALQASAGLKACVGGCTDFNTNLINTGPQTLTLLQYAPLTPTQNASWTVLGQNLTQEINFNTMGSEDVSNGSGVLTLNYDFNPDNLTFTSTGTGSGSTITASGMTPSSLVNLAFNPLNLLTKAADLPALSGSVGDLVCSETCSSAEKSLLNQASYNLLTATASLGISPSQQYSMSLNGVGETISLQVLQGNQPVMGDTATLDAADNYAGFLADPTLANPTDPTNAENNITVVPTITLSEPTFTTESGLTLVPQFTVSGLGLGAAGLNLGPLFSVSPSIPPVPQLTLNTTAISLGGFDSDSAPTQSITNSTMSAALPVAGIHNESGAYSGVGSSGVAEVVSYSHGDNFGSTTSCSNEDLIVCNAAVVGGTFNGTSGTSVLIASNNSSQSEIMGVTINGGGGASLLELDAAPGSNVTVNNSIINDPGEISSQGVVTINESTINNAGSISLSSSALNIEDSTIDGVLGGISVSVEDNSALTLSGSTVTKATLNIDGSSTVSLQNSSWTSNQSSGFALELLTGAQLSLDNSSFNIAQGHALLLGPEEGSTLVSMVNVLNGSTLDAGYLELGHLSQINIGSGSTVQAGMIENYHQAGIPDGGAIINIVGGGTLATNSAIPVAVNNSGGTVNFSGAVGSGININNQAALIPTIILGPGAPGGVVNISASILLNSSINGQSQINLSQGSALELEGANIDQIFNTDQSSSLIVGASGNVVADTIVNLGTLGIDPGGLLTVTGDYTQGELGTLLLAIDGPNDFSQLNVEGTAYLAGTLDVVVDDSFLSQLEAELVGTGFVASFDFLNFGSLDGAFTNFVFTDSSGDSLPSTFTFDVSDPAGNLDLIFSTNLDCASLAQGLLNGDAGNTGCSSNLPSNLTIPADFDTPYTGQGSLGPVSQSVPEPGTLLLLGPGLAALAFRMRRRKVRVSPGGILASLNYRSPTSARPPAGFHRADP